MWRKPRASCLAGASRAATAEPEGSALIEFVLFSPVLVASDGGVKPPPQLAAAARAAAVFAFVASAVRHHQHAALAACRRSFVGIRQLERLRCPVGPTTCQNR